MRVKTLFISFLFLPVYLFSQDLSPEQLQHDFDKLRSSLEEAHGGLYRFASQRQMNRKFDQSRKDLKHPMSKWKFYGYLSEFLANTGDGHLRIDYDEGDFATMKRPYFFPFDLLIEGSLVTIKTNDSKEDTLIKPGMQLLSVNGKKVSEIRKAIIPKMARDGYNTTRNIRRLERGLGIYYWSYIDTSSVFLVKAKDKNGKIVTASVRGILNAEKIDNRNNNPVNQPYLPLLKKVEPTEENITLRFLDNSVAYLRIGLFAGNKFETEIDTAFEKINKGATKGLILDLRGNGGGLDHLGSYLISKLITKPFRYFDHVHARTLVPSFASWKDKPPVDLVNGTVPDPAGGYLLKPLLNSCIAEQKPSSDPYIGRLVVLIDGRTFSAAGDVSSLIRHLTNAIFVGEETGGGQQGNTSALDAILKLSNSHFNVRIHLWDFWTAVPRPQKIGRGTFPDYNIARKSLDWLNGIDSQLMFATNLLR